jgi:hypothetical protein
MLNLTDAVLGRLVMGALSMHVLPTPPLNYLTRYSGRQRWECAWHRLYCACVDCAAGCLSYCAVGGFADYSGEQGIGLNQLIRLVRTRRKLTKLFWSVRDSSPSGNPHFS